MKTEQIISEAIDKLNSALSTLQAPSKSLKVNITNVGTIFASSTKIAAEDLDSDTTITVSAPDFQALAAGKINPHLAFLQGKIKIAGDAGVALQWLPILQSPRY